MLWIARDLFGVRKAELDMAIEQDLGIYGDGLDDIFDIVAERYGDGVYSWPWYRFTNLDEGVSPLWLPALIWQIVTWPFRGQFAYSSPYERLTLRHIAFVLERGEWVDP